MARTPEQTARIRARQRAYLMAYAAFASSKASWTPLRLFASGEIGAWYDPSDLTTMFQDSAGTTPVTAVGQAVGLILDKSQGLALGAELVTNGDFSGGATGWLFEPGWAIASGAATGTATSGYFYQNNGSITQGKYYDFTFTVTNFAGGSIQPFVGSSSVFGAAVSSNGTFTRRIFLSASSGQLGLKGASFSGSIDNISVKEVRGNHASQTTSAARPTISARVNLLTYSEQFDNAAWTKLNILAFGSGSVANAAVAPDGTTTADFIVPDTTNTQHGVYLAVSAVAGVTYTHSVYAKAGGYNWLYMTEGNNVTAQASFNLATGVLGTVTGTGSPSATITAVGDGWYRCTLTLTPVAALQNIQIRANTANGGAAFVGNGTSGIYIWGADLRPSNQVSGLPTYQRIAAATDYDTTGFPTFLSFDGTDDGLVTSAINFSSTDKMSVFAGLRKLSDAARGTVVELTASAAANNGAFHLTAPNAASATMAFESKGTALTDAVASSLTAPLTRVVTGLGDISGDTATIRINAVQADQDTGDQGTGNYSNAILYIGRRGGTTLPFNGNLYGLIVRGAVTSATDISSAETWMNTKTLAY